MIVSTELNVTVDSVATNADSLPVVSSCTPSATTSITLRATGIYTVAVTNAVAGTTYTIVGTVVVNTVIYTWTKTIVAPAVATGMTVAEARTIIRLHARNGTDTTAYPDTTVDYALLGLMSQFCRATRYLRAYATAAVNTTTGAFTLTSPVGYPALETKNLISVTSDIDGALLSIISWPDMVGKQVGDEVAYPEYAALSSATAGSVYPVPSSPCNVTLEYWYHGVRWTAGDAGTTILSLPSAVLDEILPVGGPWRLHQNEPENMRIAEFMRVKYLEVEKAFKNVTAGLGASYARS